jgi:hypothetical protein
MKISLLSICVLVAAAAAVGCNIHIEEGVAGGGSGGSGGAGTLCAPGAVEACYTGPPGTLDKGICAAGTRTCNADGSAFGPCAGETLPRPLENCATPEDDDCSGQATCSGSTLWSKAWGSAYTESGTSVATDANDNVYLAGMIGGSWNFGGGLRMPSNPGSPDVLLVKYDAAGNHVWDRLFHAIGSFYPFKPQLAVDAAGGIYLTGGFVGDLDLDGANGVCSKLSTSGKSLPAAFLAKLDASGACVWAKQFGAGEVTQYGTSVQLGPAGEILLAGRFSDTITIGSTTLSSQGGEDAFVAKLDASGNPAWAKAFGGPSDDYGAGTFDSQGGVVVYGSFEGEAVLDGQSATSAGEHDLFVGRYAPAGGKLWLKPVPDPQFQRPVSVLVDLENDDIVLTGSFFGPLQFDPDHRFMGNENVLSKSIFALKLSKDGVWIWGDDYIGGFEETLAAQLDPLGNLVLTGTSQGGIGFGGGPFPIGVFVVKLDKQGQHVWSRSYPSMWTTRPIGLAVDTHGDTLLTGQFDASIDFGLGELVATPGAIPCPVGDDAWCTDGFIVKLDP